MFTLWSLCRIIDDLDARYCQVLLRNMCNISNFAVLLGNDDSKPSNGNFTPHSTPSVCKSRRRLLYRVLVAPGARLVPLVPVWCPWWLLVPVWCPWWLLVPVWCPWCSSGAPGARLVPLVPVWCPWCPSGAPGARLVPVWCPWCPSGARLVPLVAPGARLVPLVPVWCPSGAPGGSWCSSGAPGARLVPLVLVWCPWCSSGAPILTTRPQPCRPCPGSTLRKFAPPKSPPVSLHRESGTSGGVVVYKCIRVYTFRPQMCPILHSRAPSGATSTQSRFSLCWPALGSTPNAAASSWKLRYTWRVGALFCAGPGPREGAGAALVFPGCAGVVGSSIVTPQIARKRCPRG